MPDGKQSEVVDIELARALAYCDNIISTGDDLERDFFSMVRRSLETGESTFEEWEREYELN